jgi:hypothetical protein
VCRVYISRSWATVDVRCADASLALVPCPGPNATDEGRRRLPKHSARETGHIRQQNPQQYPRQVALYPVRIVPSYPSCPTPWSCSVSVGSFWLGMGHHRHRVCVVWRCGIRFLPDETADAAHHAAASRVFFSAGISEISAETGYTATHREKLIPAKKIRLHLNITYCIE